MYKMPASSKPVIRFEKKTINAKKLDARRLAFNCFSTLLLLLL